LPADEIGRPSSPEETFDGFEADLVVAATSPDYSTSDVAIVGNSDTKKNAVVEQRVNTTSPSDIRVATFGNSIYRIGRYGFDNITKVDWSNENETLSVDWQYSIIGDDFSANPYDMLVVSDSSAYITRYGATDLWHVNPSAANDSDFKLAEIDLSDFANAASGNPFMADLELIDGKLFVLLVGLDDSYGASDNSSVVVIDVTDNSIVDTDPTLYGVQAIDLGVRNASNFEKLEETLYISAVGDAYNYADTTHKFSGGIVTLNSDTYATNLLLDDGDNTSAPYGNITNVVASPNGDVYFSGSTTYGDDRLYVLEIGNTVATEISLGEGQYNIADLARKGIDIYVAVHAQSDASESAGLKMVLMGYNVVYDFVEMTYNPAQIVVVE
jgi:hypothetical protein